MDTGYALKEADIICGYSSCFQSIIGNGVVSIVSNAEEKRQGLSRLMKHVAGKQEWEFDENMISSVTVFKLEVTDMSCKEHR